MKGDQNGRNHGNFCARPRQFCRVLRKAELGYQLFEVGADGAKTLVPNPTIQIIGRPETEVITTGKLQIGKKDFTKLCNRAAALLELFLHGFMQERKEMEAANAD